MAAAVQEPNLARGPQRKDGAKRRRTTRTGRAPSVDRGTPELIAKRRALVGQKFERDQRAGDPLGVLCLHCRITEEQRQAGLEYTRLCWAMWGRPFPPAGSYDDDKITRTDNTPGPMPSQRIEDAYKTAEDILLRKAGRRALHEVRNVACQMRLPDWFKRHKRGANPRLGDHRSENELVRGLRSLADTMTIWRLTGES